MSFTYTVYFVSCHDRVTGNWTSLPAVNNYKTIQNIWSSCFQASDNRQERLWPLRKEKDGSHLHSSSLASGNLLTTAQEGEVQAVHSDHRSEFGVVAVSGICKTWCWRWGSCAVVGLGRRWQDTRLGYMSHLEGDILKYLADNGY